MLLAAPRTALPAIRACVGWVAHGTLSGRLAVLCVSAIREVRVMSSKSNRDGFISGGCVFDVKPRHAHRR